MSTILTFMNKLIHKVIENKRNIIIFLFIFFTYEFFCWFLVNGDPMANYGFGHAIKIGEIPYRDFNTISTPLFAFYSSIFLHFWDNYVMFLLSQTLIVTILFNLLFKMYGKKSWLALLTSVFILSYGILPTYNFFAFFMMVIIIFLEKKYNNKDILIGIFIGLAILSKHTVGLFFIIPSFIFYFKNQKKLLKRFVGIGIPIIIFILYLIFNHALYQFVDLCILGIFDFGSSNGRAFNICFFLSIILLIISIIIVIKHPKDISNYYSVFSISFVIPLFDLSHFSLYLFSFVVMILPYLKIEKKYIKIFSITLIIYVTFFSTYHILSQNKLAFQKDLNHLNYTLAYKNEYEHSKEVITFFDKYKKYNPITITYFSFTYDISSNNKINYYDVLLYGNYGYKGSEKMIKKILKMHNQIFIVSMDNYHNTEKNSQFDKKITKYIINNSKKIDSKYGFNVYYKE